MGFLKWLYGQYQTYRMEQCFSRLEPDGEEKEKTFINNYSSCIEAGFTREQIITLMNLMASTK